MMKKILFLLFAFVFLSTNAQVVLVPGGSSTNQLLSLDQVNDILSLTSGGTVNLSKYLDNKNVSSGILVGSTLTLTLSDASTVNIDLAALAVSSGTNLIPITQANYDLLPAQDKIDNSYMILDVQSSPALAAPQIITESEFNALTTAQKLALPPYIKIPDAAPSGYSATIDNNPILANGTDSFTWANARIGSFYDYTFSTSGGATTVSGFGVITEANQQIGNIDLSTLEPGTITLTAFLSDAAGQGINATDISINGVVPSGYAALIDQDPIDSGNETLVSFTWSGAEVGSTYNATFTSSGGGTPVNVTGTIATATDQISGINLSGLADGTITLTASLTNAVGAGANVTDTATKNTAPVATQYYINRAGSLTPDSATSVGGWVAGNGISSSSSVQTRTGTTSLLIQTNTVGVEEFRYFDFSSASSGQTDFVGGETITITGWVYSPADGVPDILLTNSSLTKTAITFTPNTWTQFTFSGVTVSASGNLYFYVDNDVYFDDIEIYSTP